MGGFGTAIGVGMSAYNLLDQANDANKEMKQMQKQYQYNQQKKKNLLETQMASRRASLSAMGLGSSKSAIAAQQREAKEGYDDMQNDTENFEYSYAQKQKEKDQNMTFGLLNGIFDTTGKILK